ncbi:MAG TPA: patatin-like phospholipase family protein [Mobilitalea sp.]|nr:patatin-like phospholipase family protein [Mobilitalea sp.]
MIRESFDFSKEYGIVLEGGGAKGAYQIGVWKALMEYGVKIKAVAGVSVGALNGALMCMGDYEKAVNLWKNISYSSIMNVDDTEMDKLMNRKFMDINIQAVRSESRKFLVGGGFDVTPLRQLLEENVDEQKIRESDIDFIMGTFNVSNLKEVTISAKEAEDGYLKDYLMASANFPLFKSEKLLGKTYLDGGITNNVPIDILMKRGYKNIIVIRIYGIGMEKKVKIPEDVNLITIAPKLHLCNVLEFNKKKAVRNITLGYYDGVRLLKPLAGNDYYIDASRTEKDYLNSLLSLSEDQIENLIMSKRPDQNYGGSLLRKLLEETYPHMAALLKLEKNWRYGDLYYALLEYCAKKLHIPKYKIYTEKEFCQLLYDRVIEEMKEEEKPDDISLIVLLMIRNFLT